MSDKTDPVAAKYAPRVRGVTPAPPAAPVGSPASSGGDGASASKVNASKRRTQIFLDFRTKDGNHYALGYAYLVAVAYDKKAITLEFTGHRVTVSGRSLDKIFRGILAQVIGHVQEVDELADKATGDPKEPAVYSIKRETT